MAELYASNNRRDTIATNFVVYSDGFESKKKFKAY